MFIYNINLNGSKLYKFTFIIIILFVIILCGIVGYRLFTTSIKVNDTVKVAEVTELTNKNYFTILKEVHEYIDKHVGLKIKFSGFVYRVYDLNSEQFILGRNMIISSDF